MPRGGQKSETPSSRGRRRGNGRSSREESDQSEAAATGQSQASPPASMEAAAQRQTSTSSSAARQRTVGRTSPSSVTDEEEQRSTSGRGRGRGRGRRGSGNTPKKPAYRSSSPLCDELSVAPTPPTASQTLCQTAEPSAAADRRRRRRGPDSSLPPSGAHAQDVSRPCSADAAAAATEKETDNPDERLKRRIKNLTLKRPDIKENAEWVNALTEEIVKDLNKEVLPKLKWMQRNTGSYYDKTKISKPDEFDCMFVCDSLRAKIIYNTEDSSLASFCSLQPPTGGDLWKPKEILTAVDMHGQQYICPRAFMAWFRRKIETLIKYKQERDEKWKQLKIEFVNHASPNNTSPAVTVTINSISVDIVPAINLLEWPRPAKDWKSAWLAKDAAKVKKDAYAVAKIHPSEQSTDTNKCKLWRLSFSEAEKEIILHADGTLQRGTATGETCRKTILRLLKDDLNQFKNVGKALCSYHMKTIFLYYLDHVPDERKWVNFELYIRHHYVEALRLLIKHLERRNIPHYFIRNVNLINETLLSETKRNSAMNYFANLVKEYEHCRPCTVKAKLNSYYVYSR